MLSIGARPRYTVDGGANYTSQQLLTVKNCGASRVGLELRILLRGSNRSD